MPADTDTILKAIEAMGDRFTGAVDELRKAIQATQQTQQQHTKQISSVRVRQELQEDEIRRIKETLKELINSDALIRRNADGAILKKEPVYERFGDLGYTPARTLRTLDDIGIIAKRNGSRRTATVRLQAPERDVYRAIIVKI